ncbi:hypothetical protein IWW39_006348 [Coemansia spiralis]|uniref:Uncharacterized protein n=1 Tax=Coemansia spiralis TaxID=417178 RepID=A0A9W8GCU8_9FUNG|nr:hypothetical protein IWW39_006348 [Coemansia spiralis]
MGGDFRLLEDLVEMFEDMDDEGIIDHYRNERHLPDIEQIGVPKDRAEDDEEYDPAAPGEGYDPDAPGEGYNPHALVDPAFAGEGYGPAAEDNEYVSDTESTVSIASTISAVL